MSCFDAALGGALRRLQPLGLALVAWLACGPLAASAQSVGVSKSIPSYEYFGTFPQFYEGRYDEALNLFRKASVLRIPTPWIDSICRDAMVGECYYQMGRLDQALEAYTSAVQLYLAYPEFLIRVQLPPSLGPANITRSIPWGPSTRRARLGHFNEDMLIGTGYIDQSEVIQKGGVVQMAEWRSIRLIEILRCLALATRRRAELLGPLSEHDPVTDELVAALTRRPAPPNHWSQAWIDVLLGLALTAANKDVEAVPMLTRGLVAAGEYDHPLTSCALLALGRLALERGEFQRAARFFHEASISSVYYPDPIVLEEAFRQSALMSLLNSPKTLNAVLAPAAQWAKVKNLPPVAGLAAAPPGRELRRRRPAGASGRRARRRPRGHRQPLHGRRGDRRADELPARHGALPAAQRSGRRRSARCGAALHAERLHVAPPDPPARRALRRRADRQPRPDHHAQRGRDLRAGSCAIRKRTTGSCGRWSRWPR